jgi:hypothetical protein
MRVEEEERLVTESLEVFKEESLKMKECLDEGKRYEAGPAPRCHSSRAA